MTKTEISEARANLVRKPKWNFDAKPVVEVAG